MIPIPLPTILPSRKLRVVELIMADAAQIPLDIMERAVELLGQDLLPGLLTVERAVGTRCVCKSVDDNAGCVPHRVLAMLTDADSLAYETAHGHVVSDGEYTTTEEKDEAVKAAKAELQTAHDERMKERDEDLDEVRQALKEHAKALEQARALLTDEQREKLDAEGAVEVPKLNRDEEIKALVQERTKELAASLATAEQGHRDAVFALDSFKRSSKKRAPKVTPAPPIPQPLTWDQVDAEVTAILGEQVWHNGTIALGTGQRIIDRPAYKSVWLIEYGKVDVQLFDLDSLRVVLLRAKVLALTNVSAAAQENRGVCGNCGDEVDFGTHDRDACKPAPGKVTISGADIYEAARHLALQPSGLQAMLEVARAQRPAEFKKRGK